MDLSEYENFKIGNEYLSKMYFPDQPEVMSFMHNQLMKIYFQCYMEGQTNDQNYSFCLENLGIHERFKLTQLIVFK